MLPELTTCSSNLTVIQQTLNAMFLAGHFTLSVRMVEKEVLILCLCITLQFCYIPDKLRPVKYLCNSFMREIAGCLQILKNCTQVVRFGGMLVFADFIMFLIVSHSLMRIKELA